MRYREMRFACDTQVRLQTAPGAPERPARLVNVSATGARFEGGGQPPKDVVLMIQYLHLRLKARVVWSTERAFAVRFAAPLSGADMAALRREGGRSAGGWAPAGGHKGFRELT